MPTPLTLKLVYGDDGNLDHKESGLNGDGKPEGKK